MKLFECGKINTSFDHDSPADFLTSQWQSSEKCSVYLVYRWSMAIFFVFSFLTSFVTAIWRSEFQVYFIYLTHWNLICTTLSMLLSAVLVTLYHKNKLSCDRMTRELKALWFLSSSSYMYAFLISLIYWTLLYKKERATIDLNNVLIHLTNSLVLLIDLAVVKHPGRLGVFVYPLGCGFIFLFFSWLYPALGGLNRRGEPFIYSILDWNEKPLTAVIAAFGVLIAGLLFHCFITVFHKLRVKIHRKIASRSVKEQKTDIFTLTC